MNYWYYNNNNIKYCIQAETKEEAYEFLEQYNIPIYNTIKCANNTIPEGAKLMAKISKISFNDNGIWQPITRK